MDALLQIVVPGLPQTSGIEIQREMYEIDGKEFPREPVTVSWRGLTLQFDETTPYLQRLLPSGYIDETWVWLKVSDQVLEEYRISVKEGVESGHNNTLEGLIRALLSPMDRWIFAFILHYDQIDHVYRMDVEQLTQKLRKNLESNTDTEGFIAYA